MACYGLASVFDACELFNDLVTVAQERQTPEFLRVLGLVDEASRVPACTSLEILLARFQDCCKKNYEERQIS